MTQMKHLVPGTFTTPNGIIGLIDVLGTSKMPTQYMEVLFSFLEQVPQIAVSSIDGDFIETQSVASVFLVGDAIYFVQRDHRPHIDELIARATLDVSYLLFQQGFQHRGIILKGAYKGQAEVGKLPSLYGKGIIDAVRLEKSIKVAGIAIQKDLTGAAKSWSTFRKNESFYITPEIGEHCFLSGSGHLHGWSKCINEKLHEHSYIAAAKALIDKRMDWIECKEVTP